ncbi:MAG: 7TM diverse intracellular signaling domain-containing protein [Sulfurospirillum sp.]
MRIIFYLLLCTITLFATSLVIDETLHVTTTAKHQYGIIDETDQLSAIDVLTMPLDKPLTHHSYTHASIWTKATLKNDSNTLLSIVLRNLRPGTEYIDVFIFKNEKLIATHLLGDLRSQKERAFLDAKSSFLISLEPFSEVTIVSRFKSWGTLYLPWQLLSPKAYSQITNVENLFYGLFGGVMVALVIFNLSFFIGLRERFFIYYAMGGFFTFWSLFSTDGIFYMLDLGINLRFVIVSTWLATALVMVFSLLFIATFFKLERLHVKLAWILKGLAGVMIGFFLLFSYAGFFDESLFVEYSPLYLNLSFVFCLVILATVGWATYKKITGALFILIGEFFYIACILYISLSFKGVIEEPIYNYLVFPLGVMIEMLFFTLAISTKIKEIKNAAQYAQIVSMREKQLIEYGKIVGNIAHQWKNGLAHIGALNTEMRLLLDKKADRTSALLQQRLTQSEEAIHFLLETMRTFLNHYKTSPAQETFKPTDALAKALKMVDLQLKALKIELVIDAPYTIEIHGNEKEWYHVWLNLISNSLNAAQISKTSHPYIHIMCNAEQLRYEDNCGGIDVQTLAAIQKGEHAGLGLKMVKEILEKHGFLFEIGTKKGGFFCTILQM